MEIGQLLPSDGKVYGVWIKDGQSDVHVDIEGGAFVIGVNPNYTNMTCTNPALILNEERCEIQFIDEHGEIVWKKLDLKLVSGAIKEFLEKLKRS